MTHIAAPKILFVCKHQENARQMERVLAEAGYRVETLGTAAEFRAQVEAGSSWDLALVDISGFDEGIWAPCRRLHDAGVPFLIVGARGGVALDQAGAEHGAESVLVKPLAVRELLTLVRILLDR